MPAPPDHHPRETGPRLRRCRSVFTAVASVVVGLVAFVVVQDGLSLLPDDSAESGSGTGSGLGVSVPAPPPGASVVPLPPHQRDAPPRVGAGDTLDITEGGSPRTVVCEGGTVVVSGADNTLLITGDCLRVDVPGHRNVLRITSTKAITVTGQDNQLTIYSGIPHVTNTGFANTIESA